ncbi:FtsX-like permease family protein [Poseidonocella sp. HB161398]|uniref:FtsX-like permease family protein n=1 Tax=Poseidonocella sp. HB161398 TaxID=2320855 RepID=UPI001109C2E3|nr:FtsX-like permease family protein [Poseidonocella sp. HB161398]
MRWSAAALLSHWRRHPGQLATLLLGLALATALWTGVQAINAEARASYDRAASALAQSDLPLIVPREGDSLAVADYVALRRAGWQVAPVIEGRLRLADGSARLVGLDPLTAPALPGSGGETDPARALRDFISPPGELRGHPETLAELPAETPGRRVATEALSPGTLVADIGTAARLLGMGDRVTRLLVLAPPGPEVPPLETIAPGLREAPPSPGTDIRGLTGSFHLNLAAFGMLAFAVGLFIAHGAIGLAFEQRRGAIRTLRALGVPFSTLAAVLAAEALALALVAGAAGVAMGYVLALALLPDVAATLRGLYGAPVAGSVAIRAEWWAAGLGMALLGTMLASAQSLWQLRRLPLLAAMKPRAWALASDAGQRRLALAGLVLLCAVPVALRIGGLAAGFAALAGLLLGAALILPAALSAALALAARGARSALGEWLWADARQQVPGLSLALMALLLALSANIGVSTMVASFRATFEGWLDRRLASELYLSFDSAAQAAACLPGIPAEAVLPVTRAEADLGGAPGLFYGMADHPTYRRDWPLIAAVPQVWDRLVAGEGVLVNEQWARGADLAPGGRAQIDGRGWEVLGVYADYGNPRRQAMAGLEAFRALHPGLEETRFSLRISGDPAAEAARLVAAGLRPDQVTDQQSLKAESRAVFERTFAATDALNLLTLAVAGVAIFTSLLTLQALRLPQVAPLWAMGLTRRRLAALDLARAGLLALATALLALPVGLALAWLLLAVVNVEAFGWRLPMRLFPADWLRLGLLSLAAALLAALLPALRLARVSPARLLRVFADAR